MAIRFDGKDIWAKKKFSQNFLVDKNIVRNIISNAEVTNKDIVEIGPGLGALTFEYINEVKSAILYEIDRDLFEILNNKVDKENIKIINEDFLKANFEWEGKKIVLGNVPYAITTGILMKLFENYSKVSTATLMVQKEFADRLIASSNSSNYSKLTATVNLFGKVKKLFNVSKTSFNPAPKVDSTVIQIEFYDTVVDNAKDIMKFIKQCFGMRRKTLVNNLKGIIDSNALKTWLTNNNLPEAARPQELSTEQFIALYKFLKC